MRKKDEYKKIEIVETDSEISNVSQCNLNKCTTFWLIFGIIILYLIIIFLLFKAYFIYLDMKDQSKSPETERYNSYTKHKYNGKRFNKSVSNNSNIEEKNNYNFSNIEKKRNYIEINNTFTNISGTTNENKTKEILFTPSLLKNFTEVNQPKISILILMKEKENLVRLILGVQNQKFEDVELLIIDHNISDENASLYDDIKRRDKRVKVIEYKNKVGNLKKRFDAINNSKGEYIIFIDSDDYFIPNGHSFQEIYDKVVEDKIDILEFKSFHYITHGDYIIYQPQLFDIMYFSIDNFCDIKQFHLSGKLIKKSLLIEAFKNIDNYYLEKDMNYFEESLILLILLKKAKSFYFSNIIQTAKFCSSNDIYFNIFSKENKRDFLLYLKFLIQNTNNNVPEKRLVSSLFVNYVVKRGIKFVEKEEIEILNENINLLMDCTKISDNDHYLINSYQKEYSVNSQQYIV